LEYLTESEFRFSEELVAEAIAERFLEMTEKIRNKRVIDGQVRVFLAMSRIEIERRKTSAQKATKTYLRLNRI